MAVTFPAPLNLYLPLTGGTLTGDLLFTDATYDIGKSGATRPRDLFLSRNLAVGGTCAFTGTITGPGGDTWTSTRLTVSQAQVNATGFYAFANRGSVTAPSDGVLTLNNNASTDFGRLQLGGTTASFPALKRSGTTAAFRLADDSADAPITAAAATFSGAVTVPGVTTAALTSTSTFTSGAGAQVGTLTNAPAAGNPTSWIKIVDNGTTRYIPAW